MFTQCPKCTATFKITAEQLRQANGKVRCGKCNNIYDALSSIDDEQVPEDQPEARPEWLNDPEEERAREIAAEIAEIERTGQNLALTPSETSADASAEDDSPEETTIASEDSTAIDADEVHTDTVTQFSDAVFSIEADSEAETIPTDIFGVPDSDENDASDDAEAPADDLYYPEQQAAIDIEASGREENPDTSDIPYNSDEEVLVPVDEDAEVSFDDDNGIVFTIEDDEPAAEAIAENTLTDEDIEEILGDSSIDEGPSFDDQTAEGSLEDGEEPSSDEDEQDDTVVDAGADADADAGDDLEFNVPKQQWGKFFAGRYEGPVIDSVGPLDEPDYEALETSDDETAEAAIAPEENDHAETDVADDGEADTIVSDEDDAPETPDDNSGDESDEDVSLDDLEDLLEEESEALQTYNDLNEELTAQDEDTVEEPLIEITDELDSTDIPYEQDQDENQEEDDSDDEIDENFDIDATSESLRKAIDTLTMEKAEWRRLLESADNDTDSVYMVEEDDEHEDQDESEYEYNPAEETEAAETEADQSDEESDDEHDEDTLEDEHDDEYAPENNSEAPAMVASGFNKPTEADLSETPLWADKADEDEKPSGTRRWITAVIFILLLILLGTQIIHYKRETLATDPGYGETIRNLYAALDRPLFPAWDLSAYEIRGSEAISGESNRDVLDIRAQLAVNGDRPMGEPQIKVILKDRWGNPVNSWMFSADQYMRGMRPPNGLIQPGSLIPVHLSVVDPGSTAQGFELEICLRRQGDVLQCDSEG